MTAHKHAKLIKAKADNMELVKFIKVNGEWIVDNLGSCHFDDMCEYFLCLPKHNENGQCLHWLNGGEIQVFDGNSWDDCVPHLGKNQAWFIDGFLMNNGCDYRIKPRKEKRWIAFTTENGEMLCREKTFDSRDKAVDFFGPFGFQYIEIEVEV